jgi:hypothetical protein
VTGTLFRVLLVSVKRKMACWNTNVLLLMDQTAALDDSCVTLTHVPFVPSVKYYQLPGTTGPGHHKLYDMGVLKACSTFFVARKRDESAEDKKIEHLGCHAWCFCGMEIHHACSNSELLCKMEL